MKILFCSVPFYPSVGGIETVSALLAERFAQAGHRVTLVTQTAHAGPEPAAYEIVRRPRARRLLALVGAADVVFHNNISLRMAWPLLLRRRPWVVAHHTWLGHRGTASRAKRGVLRFARHIAISRAIARDLSCASTLVPNPYAHETFRVLDPGAARGRTIVFVGRLVSDKGCDRLVQALALLRDEGVEARLTIVGDGPEEAALRAQVAALHLAERVDFRGRCTGEALVAVLNEQALMVVPSLWEEPFGIVVLEGLACGCVPIVTRRGGLPDAVGECGLVVEGDDARALVLGIRALLDDPALLQRFRACAPAHLARHTSDRVAADYLRVLADACVASGVR